MLQLSGIAFLYHVCINIDYWEWNNSKYMDLSWSISTYWDLASHLAMFV